MPDLSFRTLTVNLCWTWERCHEVSVRAILNESLRPSGCLRPPGCRWRNLRNFQVSENKKGSSGRTRTYNPPVNRGIPSCCWELRIVAGSFIFLRLPLLRCC